MVFLLKFNMGFFMNTTNVNNKNDNFFDRDASDYIPFASTISNLKILFEKYVNEKEMVIDHLGDRHFKNIRHKSVLRCVVGLIPGLGNIFIVGKDIFKFLTTTKDERIRENGRKVVFDYLEFFNTIPRADYTNHKAILDAQQKLADNEYTFLKYTGLEVDSRGQSHSVSCTLLVTKNDIKSFEINVWDGLIKLSDAPGSIIVRDKESPIENFNDFEELFKSLGLGEAPKRVNLPSYLFLV
jgi:hypothetical protein